MSKAQISLNYFDKEAEGFKFCLSEHLSPENYLAIIREDYFNSFLCPKLMNLSLFL